MFILGSIIGVLSFHALVVLLGLQVDAREAQAQRITQNTESTYITWE